MTESTLDCRASISAYFLDSCSRTENLCSFSLSRYILKATSRKASNFELAATSASPALKELSAAWFSRVGLSRAIDLQLSEKLSENVVVTQTTGSQTLSRHRKYESIHISSVLSCWATSPMMIGRSSL